MINTNWAKWIQRAVLKHFKNNLSGHTVFLETENVDKNNLDHWFEVRIDINYKHLNRDQYLATVTVDILVMSTKKSNIYNAKMLTGAVASAYGDISVVDDNNIYKFCLRLDSDVIDTYYGEIEQQANMEQATVEGTLVTYILE